jgi:hypothetical protein
MHGPSTIHESVLKLYYRIIEIKPINKCNKYNKVAAADSIPIH